ncbi:MAG: 3'-5' exonuclease [Methyloversatilis sp.]|uniref:3'-5' exonuclease n=1 Tax=Methyloversatilis sp. TaxID=2569862 RepID=UPI0027363D49|nr:3'-5' exonuclease [Methyloversatilis sp.]MDP2868531.1 3'-5' exonuclease [Methyloversatilis sp.]
MAAVLVFDIESIPDIAGIRRLHQLPDELSDSEVAEFAFQQRRASVGHDFLPLHLQRVVVISCALRDARSLKVWSLAEPENGEGQIIQRFYEGIERLTPQIVSWNGAGFDLPVLHYRGLIHGVTAPRYWEKGEGDGPDAREFKWNNYISRYHSRHLDLMDLLALYQGRGNAPLDELAKLIGFPGKLGMDGSAVWGAWQRGEIAQIRDYCETDVLNTFLVFQRFQLMRGVLDRAQYDAEIAFVREWLAAQPGAHWKEYLAAWQAP